MNFTLEALDYVIETTGVSYAVAKEALTDANGDAEAAIAALEAEAEVKKTVEDAAEEIAEEVKASEAGEEAEEDTNPLEDLNKKIMELIKSGNVRKVVVKRDGEEVLSVPLNVGLLGGIVGVAAAPMAVILAAIAAYGLDCTIEIERKDGTTENVE